MEERLQIIEQFKSVHGERKKGIDKRITYLKVFNSINIVFGILIWSVILTSIISSFLGYNSPKWEKSGLLVLLMLGTSLNLPRQIYELKLLKHFKKMEGKSNRIINISLNAELQQIMDYLNIRVQMKWLFFSLVAIIIVLGFWQMFSENQNPYWYLAKIPVLLFFGLTAFEFYKTYNRLTKNIEKAEENL